MPVLKSLSFTSVPKRSNDPIILRRAKIVGKLEEQLAIHKDPTYIRASKRWKDVDGVKQLITVQQRIAPWWRTDAAGHTVFFIKYGSKPIEFEKGKAGISVPSKDKLPNLIETLIAAVRNGELDDILTAASGHRPFVKKKAS
jgi:hypothetical protein